MSKLTIRFPFMMRIMVVLAPLFLAYAFLSSKSVKPTTAVVLAAPMAGAIHASAYQVEVTRTGVSISFFPFVSRGTSWSEVRVVVDGHPPSSSQRTQS